MRTVAVDITDDGRGVRLAVDAGPLGAARIKEVPGARFERAQMRWTVPLAWQAALEVGRAAHDIGGEVVPSTEAGEWSAAAAVQASALSAAAADHGDGRGSDGLFGHQGTGARWLAMNTPDFPGRMLLDEVGCIAGDTIMAVHRNGSTRRMPMRELVGKLNGNGRWDPGATTYVKALRGDGTLRLTPVLRGLDQGRKEVLTLHLSNGRTLTCTPDHPVLVDGQWIEAADTLGLSIGQNGTTVCLRCGEHGPVAGARAKFTGHCRRCIYRYLRSDRWGGAGRHLDDDGYVLVTGMWGHPNASRLGWVREHVLVMSGMIGRGLRDGEVVHHVNGVKGDNRPENLRLLTVSEHAAEHADVMRMHGGTAGTGGRICFKPDYAVVDRITPAGVTDVYDLTMDDPGHNFVAGGTIVHNCGKSRTVIAALGELDSWPVLIVCPSTVKQSWAREFSLVRPDLDVVVVDGTAARRRKQIASGAHVLVMNYEAVRAHSRLRAYPGVALKEAQKEDKELNIPWAVVVADEAHRMKNPKALTTMAMWGVGASAERRWALTGTPIANSPGDLWPLLRFIDPQAWPVRSKWVDLYCRTEIDWFGVMRVVGMDPATAPLWEAGWSPVNRRVLKKQVLDLPPLLRGGALVREVPMGGQQSAAYRQMSSDMVARVQNGTLTVQNALVQSGRLVSLASAHGSIGGTPEEPVYSLAMPSNKVTAFCDDYEGGDYPGSSVVATASRQLLLLLAAEMDRRGMAKHYAMIHGGVPVHTRGGIISRFQSADGPPLLLVTIGAGGIGITLTKAQRIILLQRSWSAVEMEQMINRVHRIGSEQHDCVSVVDYVTPQTVEVHQMERMEDKEWMAQEVLNAKSLALVLGGGGR